LSSTLWKWESEGTARYALTVTAADFVVLYPPHFRFRGRDGAWLSEGGHSVSPYRCVRPNGACRGAKPL
jgi:hypothetical protein